MSQQQKQILSELEELVLKLDIKIRYEKTDAKGGLCTHLGQKLVIINRKSPDNYKIAILLDVLKTTDLRDVFITPRIRELLDSK